MCEIPLLATGAPGSRLVYALLENLIHVVVSVSEGVGVLYEPLFAAGPLDIDLRF